MQAVRRLLNLLTGSLLCTIGCSGDIAVQPNAAVKGIKLLESGQLAEPVYSAPHVQKTGTVLFFFFFCSQKVSGRCQTKVAEREFIF